jgi:hypothetical protein
MYRSMYGYRIVFCSVTVHYILYIVVSLLGITEDGLQPTIRVLRTT